MIAPERIILVGVMCSGKSTVGRLVAERLGWSLIDFDQAIEASEGKTIAEIFRDRGETYFRRLEARLTAHLIDEREVVLAPGGGWVIQRDLVEQLRSASLMVWLRVSPERAWDRHRRQAMVERPLLAVEDPLTALRAILAEREKHYREADAAVDTDVRDPRAVASDIVALLRRRQAAVRPPPLTSG